jgi:hypothetical protein
MAGDLKQGVDCARVRDERILHNEGQQCVYTASKLEGTIAIPGELDLGPLVGTAKRIKKLSDPSCAETTQVRLLFVWLTPAFNVLEPWSARTIE